MTLEVEMPHPDMPGMKQKGRVYVCDLAGTEPAGDIVYALYEKKVRLRRSSLPGTLHPLRWAQPLTLFSIQNLAVG